MRLKYLSYYNLMCFDVIQIYQAKNKISNFGLVINIFFSYTRVYTVLLIRLTTASTKSILSSSNIISFYIVSEVCFKLLKCNKLIFKYLLVFYLLLLMVCHKHFDNFVTQIWEIKFDILYFIKMSKKLDCFFIFLVNNLTFLSISNNVNIMKWLCHIIYDLTKRK